MSNGTAKRSGSDGTQTAVLRLADLEDCEISFSDMRNVILTDAEVKKYALSAGDVIFVRVNGSKENVGKSYYFAGKPFRVAYCDHLIRCTPTIVLNGKLLSMFMRCGYVRQLIGERMVSAAGQNTISQPSLGTILLPLPPLPEQDRIIQKLEDADDFIAQISGSKQKLSEMIARTKAKILDLAIRGQLVPQDPADEPASILLERISAEKEELIRQGKIKRDKKESVIFRGEDNSYYAMIDGVSVNLAEHLGFELPDGWIWISLKDIALITSGKTPRPDQLSSKGSIPYFKVADMNTLGNELHLRHTDCYINDQYSGPIFESGSFVFPKNGGAVLTNKKRILDNASVVDLNTGVFTPSQLLNQDYIFFLFSSIDFSKIHKGAVIPTVDSTVIGNLLYGLPPIEEQKRIADILKNLFSQLEQIEIALS